MNKLFTKIAALVLGMTMAVGVGVAVASNSKEASPVHAADTKVSFTTGSNTVAIKVNWNSAGAPSSNNGVRMGTSSNAGSATFSIPSGTTKFGFYAVGWNAKATTASVSASVGTISTSTASLTSNSAASGTINANATVAITETETNAKKEFSISNVTESSTITLTTSGTNKRLIAWDAYYVTEDKTLSSIAVTSDNHRTFEVGDAFVKETITATYSDASKADVTNSATFSGYNMSSAGEQTVSVSYTEGGVEKNTSYTITVNSPKALSSITLSGTYPTSFFTGDEFNHEGMTVTANFDDTSSADVTSSATFSGYNMATAGNQTVTVSYEYASVTKTATYGITVADRILTGITLSGQTTSYSKNASFSFDGTCTASYSNAASRVVTPTSVSSPDMSSVGTKEVTVSYTESGITKEAKYDITVTKDPKPGSTVYTLDGTTTGSGNAYADGHDITQSELTWNVTGNIETNPWRIGGKSITSVDREIYSKDSIDSAIAQIDLELGTAASITVNSVTLIVASDDTFESVVDTIGVDFAISGTSSVFPTSLSAWPANSYYKFVFNVTVSGNSNKFVQFIGAEFKTSGKYSATIQGPDSVDSGSEWAATGIIDEDNDPVLGATYSFSAVGATITESSTSGTFTATGTGTVTVSADAGSMYEVTSKEVIVVGEDPTITPSTETAGGYAGQEQTVSFIYANLDNDPSVVSNDETVVTISDLTYSEGSGSVKLNFAGPGTNVDVYFKDGENALATVVVNVETPVVTISEATISVAQGHEKGLTATSSYGIIDWECDCVTSDVVVIADLQHSNTATVRVSQSATIGFKAKVTAYITAYPAAKAECVVTVTEVIEYTKATNINQLWNGQKVVIGNASGSVIAKGYDGTSSNIKGYATSGESSVISEEDATNACVYTLNQVVYDSDEDDVVDSMAWTLFDGKYYLYAASTSANHLKGKTEADIDCYWNITFSNDELVVTSVTNESRPNMRYNPNNGSPIFSCYASGQSAVAFYVLDANSDGTSAAKAFVDSYMHMDSDVEGQCLGYYPIAKVVWNNLDSAAKAKVESDKPAAFKRLQDWAAANGDHIDGDSNIVANTRISIFGNAFDNNNAIAIVVIVSVVSLTAIGGYFFLRKKREQN